MARVLVSRWIKFEFSGRTRYPPDNAVPDNAACRQPVDLLESGGMTESSSVQSHLWSEILRRHGSKLVVLAGLLLIAAIRVRLLDLPLERDEGEYAYAGQLMLEGIPPYKLAYNMKFPGTYAAYALIMAVFGQTPAAIHLGVTCVTTLTALMLYWLGRRLLDEITGVVAATGYAVLAASPSMLGLAGHATHFAALLATAGVCLLWPDRKRGSWVGAAMSGFMFGMAILMKQHAVFLCLWGLVLLIIESFRLPHDSFAKRVYPATAYCAGAALPLGVACLLLWRAGVFEQFWFWTFTYGREYVSVVPIGDAPEKLWAAISKIATRGALLWLVALSGLRLVWLDHRLRETRFALVGLFCAAGLTTCPGFYFRVHYFLLVLPAAALIGGCAVSTLCHLYRRGANSTEPSRLPLWGFSVLLAVSVFENRAVWFGMTPTQAARAIYHANLFPEAEVVAGFIRTNTPNDARVAVLGSEPEVYFLSHRHSATGYIYTYALMEPQPMARQMHEQMIQEIESVKPESVVCFMIPNSWLSKLNSETRLLDWWQASYQTNYTVTGVLLMDATGETRFVWGEAAQSQPDSPMNLVTVYSRKSRAAVQ